MNARIRRANHIDDNIIQVLKESNRPMSTREICLKTKRAWHSIDSHCLRLQNSGKLEVIRAGNITLWSLKK